MTEDLLELSTVCKKYFGITLKIARRKAAMGTLPIPAFRVANSQKGPLFVNRADLEKLVAANKARAEKLHLKLQIAAVS
jgi:Pyocin activator protein PrtN